MELRKYAAIVLLAWMPLSVSAVPVVQLEGEIDEQYNTDVNQVGPALV